MSKICIDCQWLHRMNGLVISGCAVPATYKCRSPKLNDRDLVTGVFNSNIDAYTARESERLCGPDAKHFEMKDSSAKI